MLASPKQMIESGFVKNLIDEAKQVQPNAIDWTVDAIQEIDYNSPCHIGEGTKIMRRQLPLHADAKGDFFLEPGEYDVSSNVYVEVPEGKAALLILRSTFVRNGCVLASGLYDSGFKGNIGAVLHVNGPMTVEKGVRIGQIMFIDSDSVGKYAGGYNTADGQHWKEKVAA